MLRTAPTQLLGALAVGVAVGLLTYWGSIAVDGDRRPPTNIEKHDLGYSYTVAVNPPEWARPVALALGVLTAA